MRTLPQLAADAPEPLSVTIEVRNRIGTLLKTFNDPERALKWARQADTIKRHGSGLIVERVCTYEERERLSWPRLAAVRAERRAG
jgi:hypothetical protein